jgi:hypothetical protein
MTLVMVRSLVHWPALASTWAGIPTSRNAAAVVSLCLHHEAGDLHERFLQLGEPVGLFEPG